MATFIPIQAVCPDMLDPEPSDYDCPNCGSSDTAVRPTSDMFECNDCGYTRQAEDVEDRQET